MNYAYFIYTSLCDRTNTRTEFLSFFFCAVAKRETFFVSDSAYDWLYPSTK
jgi:hypothetical protein